jgi:hypothetical protein
METPTESRSFSYSVFSFVTDEMKGTAIPVGVALWGSGSDSVWMRFAEQREQIKGLNKVAYFQIEGIRKELCNWVRTSEMPYAGSSMSPHSDSWWRHVARLLVHQIRAGEPRPIDCINPVEEIDSLFEAVVGPRQPPKERAQRIDRALTRCLGKLARKLDKGSVNGYKGREIEVHRFKTSSNKLLIVDGVNLASVYAEAEADALVSKLLRIKAGSQNDHGQRMVKLCIGYIASPHGLNGEATLVDWIQEKAEAETFDLTREGEKFLSAVDNELAAIIPQTRFQQA